MDTVLSRRQAALALASGLAGFAARPKGGAAATASIPFATLDENAEPLRDDFNGGAGNVRLLLLIDPICPTCLRGLADIDRDLLSKLPRNAALRTYIVHEPVIGGTDKNIAGAASLVHAPARHFWSATGSFGRLAAAGFDLHHDGRPVYAWDVWTIYGPDTIWRPGPPPAPRLLMHQLGALAGDSRFPRLDSGKFASQANAMLASLTKARGAW